MSEQLVFHRYIPGHYPPPPLLAQLVALEEATGATATIRQNMLSVFLGETYLSYVLKQKECVNSGELKWILLIQVGTYTVVDKLKRPELLEITVCSIQTKYRGVVYGKKTYWTEDVGSLDKLKKAVEDLNDAQNRISLLIGES